jgi:peptidoglycan/LPS O-acetylase OafA/YrhL
VPPTISKKRIPQLDGLRGFSSLLVCVHHFVAGFIPNLVVFNLLPMPWFARTPLCVVFSGNFVYLFFVLSGFVLAESAARRRQPFLLRACTRYLRLALPIMASLVFAWLLTRAFPRASHELVRALPQQWMSYSYSTDLPSFWHVFPEGFYWVFRHGYCKLNNVLWTMHAELYGSVFIFLVYVVRDTRKRLLLLVLAGISTIFILHSVLSFVFGAFLREAWVAGKFGVSRWGAPAFVVALVLIASQPVLSSHPDRLVYPVGGALAIIAVLMSPALEAFFSGRIPVFLGRVSFSLYLLHVPLLITVFATAYLAWRPMNGWKLAGLFVGFLATALTLAYGMTVMLDQPLTRALSRFRATRTQSHDTESSGEPHAVASFAPDLTR